MYASLKTVVVGGKDGIRSNLYRGAEGWHHRAAADAGWRFYRLSTGSTTLKTDPRPNSVFTSM